MSRFTINNATDCTNFFNKSVFFNKFHHKINATDIFICLPIVIKYFLNYLLGKETEENRYFLERDCNCYAEIRLAKEKNLPGQNGRLLE